MEGKVELDKLILKRNLSYIKFDIPTDDFDDLLIGRRDWDYNEMLENGIRITALPDTIFSKALEVLQQDTYL